MRQTAETVARPGGGWLTAAPVLVALLLVARSEVASGQMGMGMNIPDAVIIVGAGMSGIAAARTLADKNIYSIVLEVRAPSFQDTGACFPHCISSQ